MSACVLICGAGPVGLALALQLAHYGVAVRIIDKNCPSRSRLRISQVVGDG